MTASNRHHVNALITFLTVVAGAGSIPACGAVPDDASIQESAVSGFDPTNFVRTVTNPFFPLKPGTTFTYAITLDPNADQTITEVTRQTKRILGVDTIVVHDQALLQGEVVEDTFDYFAQDKQGNVRYFGEDTVELDNGVVVSTAGTFHAGSNGADPPHIIMEAHPKVGDLYFEEFAPNDGAEDQAEVLSVNKGVKVPFGSFHGCLETKNFTALEPDQRERKIYCANIGLMVSDATKGDPKHEALVSIVTR